MDESKKLNQITFYHMVSMAEQLMTIHF